MNEDCIICLDILYIDDTLLTLKCSHKFHSKCIKKWLVSNQTCPICRYKVDDYVRDNILVIRNLKIIQVITFTDLVISGINIIINPSFHIPYNFICCISGYFGIYNLNTYYLILYGISRLCMIDIDKIVIDGPYDLQRIISICVSLFYMYIYYLTYIIHRDVEILQ